MSKIEVDTVEPQSGTSLTLGASGDTITIPSGAIISNQGTAAGFGPTGAVSWNTTPITADPSPAVSGVGYFADTTSGAFTITLPAAPSAGAVVGVCDYAGTFGTNNLTIDPNGLKIGGSTIDVFLSTDGIAVTLVYVDATQGWIVTDTGSRTETPQTYSVDFLVIAGGGGGGTLGGGGGAGGYRTSTQSINIGTTITVTVGDGGAGSPDQSTQAVSGSDSSISSSGLTTITSAGGGRGGLHGGVGDGDGASGGSGGGGAARSTTTRAGGVGNTPSTSPSQGNNGGSGHYSTVISGGGGGGASAVGVNATVSAGGNGGNGTASSITGSSITRGGGGGGAGRSDDSIAAGTGGTGGGGNATNSGATGDAGTANTGGGGGAGGYTPSYGAGGAGGKGVVILSIPTVNYSGTTTGSPVESTSGANKILIFNGDGSYTT